MLRQGLANRHVFTTALVSALCDALLIALGVGGLGTLFAADPRLSALARYGGAAFLLFFGARSFLSAFRTGALDPTTSTAGGATRRGTILAALGFSLLNPHVYLDTVILLGSIGSRYLPGPRLLFAIGAILASFSWFFGLAFGAARLAPLLRDPRLWRALDLLIALVMWGIALTLVVGGS